MKVRDITEDKRNFIIENPHGDEWELITSSEGVVIISKFNEDIEKLTHERALLWVLGGIAADQAKEEGENK